VVDEDDHTRRCTAPPMAAVPRVACSKRVLESFASKRKLSERRRRNLACSARKLRSVLDKLAVRDRHKHLVRDGARISQRQFQRANAQYRISLMQCDSGKLI